MKHRVKFIKIVLGIHEKVESMLSKGRIMLPKKEKLIQMIMTKFHTSKVAGHAGITRTLKRISTQFY